MLFASFLIKTIACNELTTMKTSLFSCGLVEVRPQPTNFILIEAIEKKYDEHFKVVFEAIKQLTKEEQRPKKSIGFHDK